MGSLLLILSIFVSLLVPLALVAVTAMKIYRPKRINGLPNFEFENVEFVTDDNLTIRGWWIEGDAKKPVIVLCHGINFSRADLLPIAIPLMRQGYSLLLFDFRGCGESDGKKNSFGYYESKDVVAAARFLKDSKRLDNRQLAFFGTSMGASAILHAGESLQKIIAVDYLIIDSCFSRFEPLIAITTKDWPKPFANLFQLTSRTISAVLFAIPTSKIKPIDHVKHFGNSAVLVIHSKSDAFVPLSQAEELFDAIDAKKENWWLEGWAHGETFIGDAPGFASRLCQFID